MRTPAILFNLTAIIVRLLVCQVRDCRQAMVRRRDFRVSTLRRYLEALGAELEVSGVIGGRRVQLLTSESAAGAPSASAAAT